MFDDVEILTGGHQGGRHEEDQGRLRSKQPASRGANHVKSTSPQHRPPFRNAQGMYVPKHSLHSRPPPEISFFLLTIIVSTWPRFEISNLFLLLMYLSQFSCHVS